MNVKPIKIFKGQSFLNSRINQINSNKIITFDLDETLGYFVEFGIFWDSLSLYLSNQKL